MRDIKDSTTTTLATRVQEQLASLRGLQARLTEVRDYLRQVARGALPINHTVVYHLQDALNLLPDLDVPSVTGAFTTNTNDQLLVVYLSSLIRAVIALEKLVDNKATNGMAELEESVEKSPEGKTANGKKAKTVAAGEGNKDSTPDSDKNGTGKSAEK